MWRALKTIVFFAIIAIAGSWLADNPGVARFDWIGYQVEMPIGVFLGIVIMVLLLVLFFDRVWILLRNIPDRIAERRRRKGYDCLNRGMIAVAAGDRIEARKLSRKATGLLSASALTSLLAAQSAQLNGDKKAAEYFFKAMSEEPKTAFLGLRGLINQAMKDKNTEKALRLVRKAYRLNPESPWVIDNLLALQTHGGYWSAALETLKQGEKIKALPSSDLRHHKAVLELQMALEAESVNDISQALHHAEKALSFASGFVPAIITLARLLLRKGRRKKVLRLLEKHWAHRPHPDLPAFYFEASREIDSLVRVKTAERLARTNPDHMESRLLVAETAIEAELWGCARKALLWQGQEMSDDEQNKEEASVSDEHLSVRFCRLMARLEKGEYDNKDAERMWLERALQATPEPLWICEDCGYRTRYWSAVCKKCQAFDRFRWMTPEVVEKMEENPYLLAPPAVNTGSLSKTS